MSFKNKISPNKPRQWDKFCIAALKTKNPPLLGALGVFMSKPLPISTLLEEWLCWVIWITSDGPDESLAKDLIGQDEFLWIAQEHPEHAWDAILSALKDERQYPYLGYIAAGPLEDLLSYHGDSFIGRVELEAAKNVRFADMLGGVWKSEIPDHIWERVQSCSKPISTP